MTHRHHVVLALGLLFAVTSSAIEIPGKRLYIPEELRSNDFESDTAQWSYSRMLLTENFAIFWERGFGKNLDNPPRLEGHRMDVDLPNLAEKLERFYHFYRDTLHFITEGSKAETYRMLVMLNYSLDGTAYGGDYDNTIGAFWVAPNRLRDSTLNCVAHELGHSFQMQATIDASPDARWLGGGFFEMASQWMLWQVNPNWVHDEAYHWEAYRHTPHRALFHWENVYHTPYVIQWWAERCGHDIVGRIFREGRNPEDPADVYMRLTGKDDQAFNDELFEAHRHTVFLDFVHARHETRPFAGGFATSLTDELWGWHRPQPLPGGAWMHVDSVCAPEAGGFNAIPLSSPAPGSVTEIDFDGADSTRWHHGFVAMLADGRCTYSAASTKGQGRDRFTAPRDVAVRELYFVVMPDRTRPNRERPRRGGHPRHGRPAEDTGFSYRLRLR